jgi:hypothetical protein
MREAVRFTREIFMRLSKLSTLLLSVYLILTGLVTLGLSFPLANVILGGCALAAGILILLGQ